MTRAITAHLLRKAGQTQKTARTGGVTLIQRFGSALNLNIHFHMLFLDGVYVVDPAGSTPCFVPVRTPTREELERLTHTIARRVGRYLEREGLLAQDAETGALADDTGEEGPMDLLLGHAISYRIAVASTLSNA